VKASAKAFLGLVLIMLVVMTLFFMMSTLKFETTLTHLVQSRLTVLAESVAAPLEAAMDLGLTLSELSNAEALIMRAKENDNRIDAIDIFNLSGQILFSTIPDRVGQPVDAKVLEIQLLTHNRDWNLSGDAAFSNGIILTDNIGQHVGGVLITYSNIEFLAKVSNLTESLITNTLVIAVIFGGFAYFVIRRSFYDLDVYMAQIDDAMKTFPVLTDEGTKIAGAKSDHVVFNSNDLEMKLRAVSLQLADAAREINSCRNSGSESGREHL